MKWYGYVIIGLLLLLGGAGWFYTWKQENDKKTAALKEADDFFNMARQEAIIRLGAMATQDSIIFAERHAKDSAIAAHAKSQGSLKTTIRALKTRYRPDTLRLTTVDTLVIVQDSLIVDLEAEKASVWQFFKDEIGALESKVRISENYGEAMEKMAYEQNAARTQDAKKFRRQRRKERAIEIIVLIGAIALTL